MAMRSFFIVGLIPLAAGIGQAFAICPGVPNLTTTQIANLVPGNYTCVGAFPSATWNELLSGSAGSTSGTVTDFKLGPTSPTDPTQQVGTYAISGVDFGVLTYDYSGGGGSFSYTIAGTTSPYTFCPTGGGAVLTVNVQPAHC